MSDTFPSTMSFVKSIFSLDLNVSIPEQGWSEQIRVQLAVHPEETETHVVSRTLALAHSAPLRPHFSQGLFEPKEPTFSSFNEIGNETLWGEVGIPTVKKLRKARSIHPVPQLRVYFYETPQIDQFCHLLRGSKENWIAPFTFFLLDPALIDRICEKEWDNTKRWDIVFLEDRIYLEINGSSDEGSLLSLDMWSEFQRSLRAAQMPA
ncbi:MAG: YaeQ family protein [Bdellovibrionales bacterium]|nr:YaeQ family protein [Bdellovibrionales bacterium]